MKSAFRIVLYAVAGFIFYSAGFIMYVDPGEASLEFVLATLAVASIGTFALIPALLIEQRRRRIQAIGWTLAPGPVIQLSAVGMIAAFLADPSFREMLTKLNGPSALEFLDRIAVWRGVSFSLALLGLAVFLIISGSKRARTAV
jgi:hypothetical protein